MNLSLRLAPNEPGPTLMPSHAVAEGARSHKQISADCVYEGVRAGRQGPTKRPHFPMRDDKENSSFSHAILKGEMAGFRVEFAFKRCLKEQTNRRWISFHLKIRFGSI